MATDGDRSLSSGMSLPMWMKSRMNDRLNFDQGTFSPPENDDSFFVIRYPRSNLQSKNNLKIVQDNSTADSVSKATQNVSKDFTLQKDSTQNISNKFSTENFGQSSNIFNNPDQSKSINSTNQIAPDFSKHTAPCQKFIPLLQNNDSKKQDNRQFKLKSNGTDDGFKGEAALCGSSVIRVAHQMVSSKAVDANNELETLEGTPKGFNPRVRRGSKSLPSSPLVSPSCSPKSKKRVINKYFTSAFTDADKYQGSWILSSLLGKREVISRSVDIINEETSSELTRSVSSLDVNDNSKTNSPKNVYKAKPSELREMNFWSPTSM